jgi:hypothetical protein
MAPQMLSRRGQLLSRLATRPSLAGTGLVERMRSTTFALLGVTAAMGLGLVALISQQGWPYLPAIPIPGPAAKHGTVHDAVAVARPRLSPGASTHRTGTGSGGTGVDRRPGAPPLAHPHPSGSHQSVAPLSPAAGGTGGQPAGEDAPGPAPAPQPPSQSPAPAPVSTPAPTPGPTATTTSPATSSALSEPASHGKGNAYGHQKTASSGSEKSHPAEPHSAPLPAAPSATDSGGSGKTEPPAAAEGPPEGPGNGHGHAYGLSGK